MVDSRTKWMTDKEVTAFLTFEWNSDSTLLATHDSGAKHSKLNIYRISPTGDATSLEVPDLVSIAAAKLGLSAATVSASGQRPVKWLDPQVIEVSVGLTTSKGKQTARIPLRIEKDGRISTQ
jgi:hypothetical protein